MTDHRGLAEAALDHAETYQIGTAARNDAIARAHVHAILATVPDFDPEAIWLTPPTIDPEVGQPVPERVCVAGCELPTGHPGMCETPVAACDHPVQGVFDDGSTQCAECGEILRTQAREGHRCGDVHFPGRSCYKPYGHTGTHTDGEMEWMP